MTSLLLLLLASPSHANRAVMEAIAVSNNTVYIDTVNARVGIDTTTPATALDVAGVAQFGQGATKSTFSVTGSLTLASGATINSGAIASSAIDTSKLSPDAVTAAKILNGAITTAKFSAGAVDTTAMGTDAVSNAKILNGSVDTNKMAPDAITNAKIINGTIDTIKLKITNNGPGGVAIFDSNGMYPAKDGSLITNIAGTISGLTVGVVPVASAANTIGNGQSYITSVSSGVRISTGLVVGSGTIPVSESIAIATSSGVIVSSTPFPSLTLGTGTLSTTSNNQSGQITTAAGTATYTVTFSRAWKNITACLCSSTARSWWTSAISNTSFTCTNGGTGETGTTVIYFCWGAP